MARLSVLGLAKCSTCQKALADLREAGHEVHFRDVSAEPLSQDERRHLLDLHGDKLLNRASLTWRGMSEAERAEDPLEAMAKRPALMKRPAIEGEGGATLGWTANVKRRWGVPA